MKIINKPLEVRSSFYIPGILQILGFILLIIYSAFSSTHWSVVLTTTTMVMLASFSVGALVGFIFGIPRTLQEDVKKGVKANSNLEQLSDWLTKIIVGVGLVESKEVFQLVSGLAENLSQGFPDTQMGFTIILSTLIFYFFGGFFISYLWSRILLERIFQENLDTENRIVALEKTRDLQDEISELQSTYKKEKAKSIIEKSFDQTKDDKELANTFAKIVGTAYENADYSAINQWVKEYDKRIKIPAQTWSDAALANLNLYRNSLDQIYADSVEYACRRSIQALRDYGVPQMIRLYLQLINYKEATANQDQQKQDEARKSISAVIELILKNNAITAYEAYAYMQKNDVTSFKEYNEIFKTEFKAEYQKFKDKYLEHLSKNQS